jgi:hypothetical protein
LGREKCIVVWELHDLCFSPNIIKSDQVKEDEMGGACGTNGEEEHAYFIGRRARRKETTRETKTLVGG